MHANLLRNGLILAMVGAGTAILSGCRSEPVAVRPAAEPSPVAAVPASVPAGQERKIAIRLTGNVKPDAPQSVTVDDLEKLPQSEFSVMDPYEHRQIRYRGVLVRDLVAHYGKPGTKALHLRAIDDFKADLTEAEWTRWGVLLATRTDGQRMNIANKGPARIVFPYDTCKEIDPVVYNDKWIWQVNRITFE